MAYRWVTKYITVSENTPWQSEPKVDRSDARVVSTSTQKLKKVYMYSPGSWTPWKDDNGNVWSINDNEASRR